MSAEQKQAVQDLYEKVIQEARAVVSPPLTSRDLTGGLN
jgi:hypothetical protein